MPNGTRLIPEQCGPSGDDDVELAGIVLAQLPERRDQIDRRKAKGSAGGRPPTFDAVLYGLRNTVERGFNRLKQWRGIATHYDKYA